MLSQTLQELRLALHPMLWTLVAVMAQQLTRPQLLTARPTVSLLCLVKLLMNLPVVCLVMNPCNGMNPTRVAEVCTADLTMCAADDPLLLSSSL